MRKAFAVDHGILKRCGRRFSFFFDLIEKEWSDQHRATVHRICTLMRKMGVRCLLREELELKGELLAERKSIARYLGCDVHATAIRVTFFRRFPRSGKIRNLQNDDVLGYAVFFKAKWTNGTSPNEQTYIYESVVRPPTFFANGKAEAVTNYYVHCSRPFKTSVGPRKSPRTFRFPGTFFCQQNGKTHFCAHAALRIALNSWPRYKGNKVTPDVINSTLGYDHTPGKQVPKDGLSRAQIETVVKRLGYGVVPAEFISSPEIDYDEFIYPLIESGSPVILGIVRPNVAHVVAVLGHTLNTDRWAEARHDYGTFPLSPYISTASWADHFIVSDDNFGMYVTLPTEALRNVLVPKHNPNLHAAIAMGLVPTDLRLSGYLAEQWASKIVENLIAGIKPKPDNRWMLLLQKQDRKKNPVVCRTLLIDKAVYLNFMTSVRDEMGHRLSAKERRLIGAMLPKIFWVTEVSVPNLYTGNKHKLGEIITLPNPTDKQLKKGELSIFAWMSGICWYGPRLKHGPNAWSLTGHIPLLRGIAPANCAFEW